MARHTIRYQKSSKGTIELMTSEEMLAVMMARAEAGKGYAEGLADEFSKTGHYKASFRVAGVRRGGPKKDRAEARLINDAVYGAAVEAKHDVLGRTVDHIEGHGG
jgi:hypothetical protein